MNQKRQGSSWPRGRLAQRSAVLRRHLWSPDGTRTEEQTELSTPRDVAMMGSGPAPFLHRLMHPALPVRHLQSLSLCGPPSHHATHKLLARNGGHCLARHRIAQHRLALIEASVESSAAEATCSTCRYSRFAVDSHELSCLLEYHMRAHTPHQRFPLKAERTTFAVRQSTISPDTCNLRVMRLHARPRHGMTAVRL